jgi:predicted Kef-type K+ transport protein
MDSIWLALAFALGLVFKRLGFPPLVGYLAAGFALGSTGVATSPMLHYVAHTGVLLLLFTVGLKLRLRNIARVEVWGAALVHLALTAVILLPLLVMLRELSLMPAILITLSLGFSSTVLAAKALEAKHEMQAFHGRVCIGILVVQDLVAVALLTSAGGGSPSPWALGVLLLPLLRPLLLWLMTHSGHDELLVLFGVLAAVAGGGAFATVGLSSELGALVVGAMLAGHPRTQELSEHLWGLKEVMLVAFFLEVGLAGVPNVDALLGATLLLLLLPLKCGLFFLLLLRFRLRARSAFLAALALTSYSEFALIVAGLAESKGLISEQWLVTLAVAVALSFAAGAWLNRLAHNLYARLEHHLLRLERPDRHPDQQPLSLGSARVVIMGMGRMGAAAYDFLTHRGERVVGLDSDPGKVELHLHEGRRVLYADAEDPGFWHDVNLRSVKAVLLAVPDLEAKTIAARELRRGGFTGLITTTNLHEDDDAAILGAGADSTFNYFSEAGVGFAEHAWETLHPEEEQHRVASS